MRCLTTLFMFLLVLGCQVSGPGSGWPTVEGDSSGPEEPAADDDDSVAASDDDDDTAAADDDDTVVPYNAATVVGSSFPESLLCGEEGTASIELLNEGNTSWTREAGYRLGTVDDEDPLHDSTRVYLPEQAHVAAGEVWTFEVTLQAPEEEGVYTTDWRMVEELIEWFGEVAEAEVEVSCPPEEEWEYTGTISDSVLAHATYVRNNYPQFFDLEALDGYTKRSIAYEMMTTVINLLRADGVDASRCVANPGLPQSDPFYWCSDALVVGPPGIGVTLDIYWSWSYPGTPQTSVTGTGSTGVVTSDLTALQ